MSEERVQIAGWSSKGLRCPDYTISFDRGDGEVHRVSLIQMPNGTGKTTTLNLLRAALSGRSPTGENWEHYPIEQLAKPGTERGEFAVHLLYNGNRWSFRIEFDFATGQVELFTTRPGATNGGEVVGFSPPRELEQLLSRDFVRFFVFDGELAHDLTDHRKHNAEQAIDALFQLSNFTWMARWAEDFLESRIKHQMESGAGAGSTDQGLTRQINLIERIRDRLTNLRERFDNLEKRHGDAKQRALDLENATRAAIQAKEEFGHRFDAAVRQRSAAQVHVEKLTNELLNGIRDPHQVSADFAGKMVRLRESFDRVKLPENTAREWFEELADEPQCVCGREITPEVSDFIREQASYYLGSNDVALLNQLKQEVATQVVEPYAESETRLRELIAELSDATDELGHRRAEVEKIHESAAEKDPDVERQELELKEVRDAIRECETELRQFAIPDRSKQPDYCFNISELEGRLKREKKRLDEIAETVSLRWKTELLTTILQTIHRSAIRDLGTALAETVNTRLSELMPDNAVRLQGIEQSLQLSRQKGASVGETLTVAYAFLSCLAHRSSYALPLIIDTPAAPIDNNIRAQIGRLLPKLVRSQFIAFTISPERGSFIDGLEVGSGGDVQYCTLFRKSNSRLAKTIELYDGRVESSGDAYLVHGREYFQTFQDDAEYHRAEAPAQLEQEEA